MKKLKKILVVDDDRTVCDLLKIHLEKEDYDVIIADDGNEAMLKFNTLRPEMIILEVNITGIDGWQLCREIRKIGPTPVIFLTEKSEIFDKILAFELGADDYIIKPFDVREVVARIRAIARRAQAQMAKLSFDEITLHNLYINLTRYIVKINGKIVNMAPKELELLYFFASNPNRVYTRNQLLDEIWGVDYYGDFRTVDVHIKRLRAKLKGVSDKWKLATVWGVGYKFECE